MIYVSSYSCLFVTNMIQYLSKEVLPMDIRELKIISNSSGGTAAAGAKTYRVAAVRVAKVTPVTRDSTCRWKTI